MASPFPSAHNHQPMRYIAKYRCKQSRESWKVRNSRAGKKNCLDINERDCVLQLEPCHKEPMDIVTIYKCPTCLQKVKRKRALSQIYNNKQVPYCRICNRDMENVPRRMYGEYECSCGNTWSSGNSWTGMGQECKDCNTYISPWSLKPLRSTHDRLERPAHKQELCGMCQKLGTNCRDWPSVDDEEVDDDDDLSVVTSICRDESLTPPTSGETTPTDSGDNVADAVEQLQNMSIQN